MVKEYYNAGNIKLTIFPSYLGLLLILCIYEVIQNYVI